MVKHPESRTTFRYRMEAARSNMTSNLASRTCKQSGWKPKCSASPCPIRRVNPRRYALQRGLIQEASLLAESAPQIDADDR